MNKYRVLILPEATDDLKQAKKWYRQHNAELPKRFIKEVKNTINRIRLTPFANAIRYQNVHVGIVPIFPYCIHYIVEEDEKTLVVLAIHHTSMSPENWQKRLK